MSDIVLELGPITFQDFEIPSGVTFGGAQRLAVHRLIGGGRVIDSLGGDDAEIGFCGVFSGSNATVRARLLDELRVSGMALQLTWDVFFYTVIISKFRADYQNRWWIPYRIACTIVRDEASALLDAVASLTTLALADVSIACGQAMSAGLDLFGATAPLDAPGAMVRGTAAYNLGQAGLADAQSSLGVAMAAAAGGLNNSGLSVATSAHAGVSGLAAAVGAAQQLTLLTNAQAYVGRAATNLTSASS